MLTLSSQQINHNSPGQLPSGNVTLYMAFHEKSINLVKLFGEKGLIVWV